MALKEHNQITMDNIDELEVHLTIIAKNPSAVKSMAAFLTRRDWPTKIISNANEAIESIAKDKPDIVLLSFNHPHLNVEKFANLLLQTFNMTCVGFSEKEERAATQKFHASKLKYKLAGSASGPTIHRFVRKILIEKYGLNNTETESKVTKEAVDAHDEEDGMIFAGSSSKSHGKTSFVKGEQTAANGGTIVQQGIGSGPGGTMIEEGLETTDSGTMVEEGVARSSGKKRLGKNRATQKGETITEEGAEELVGEFSAEHAIDDLLANEKDRDLSSRERNKGKTLKQRPRKTVDEENLIDEEEEIEEEDEIHEGREIHGRASRKKNLEVVETADGESYTMTAPSMLKKKRLSALTKAKIAEGQRTQTKESITEKETTLHASMSEMLQTIEPSSELGSHPDDPVEWIGILPMVAQDFQGYLAIPVTTKPDQAATDVLQKIKNSIIEDLKKKGIEPKIEDGFFIQVAPTYFSSLAKGRAQFVLQQGMTEDSELCVSYFASTMSTQEVKKVNKSMSTINVEGVSTQNPIDFKVYLHLDKNKKYFLYLNNGRTLSESQKSRLKKNGVSSFFIKNSEVDNFRKYLASTFVNNLITSLKEELNADERKAENQ